MNKVKIEEKTRGEKGLKRVENRRSGVSPCEADPATITAQFISSKRSLFWPTASILTRAPFGHF